MDDVLEIHRDQIARYGGSSEIRDPLLLQAAVAQASATFDGVYLHPDLIEMASAYLFHLVMNHPFVDGNKRTGSVAALVFLYLNGIRLKIGEDAFADLVWAVAQGRVGKSEIGSFLRNALESQD
ncbi:MAG: type II toxin-antitoxin system death-on-curing family toxin [FCB group bacterium]|nr:type II toxin-antitoxin system death-on-curing family toxin [FCB group bacterium]